MAPYLAQAPHLSSDNRCATDLRQLKCDIGQEPKQAVGPERPDLPADVIWHRHSVTVSACRWATFHSPPSRRYTWVARKV